MAKSSTEITVTIGTKPAIEYKDLLEYSIDSNVLTLADAFEVKFANPSGNGAVPVGGESVSIYASDPDVSGGARFPIMKGIAVSVLTETDEKGGTTVSVSGCDLGWHLVNNCGPLFKSTMTLTFEQLLDLLLGDYGKSWGFNTPSRTDNDVNRRLSQGRAAVAPARSKIPVFIPPVCFEAGEMVADKLITYARRAKCLVNVSVDGYLQIFQPSYNTPPVGTLHFHRPTEAARIKNNVKAPIRIRSSIDGVFTDVICVGTVAVPSVFPDRYNPHAGTFQGEFQDLTQLPFRHYKTFCESDAMIQAYADDRARWALERGQFEAWTAEYNFFGHVLGGTFIAPDTMIGVDDTVNGVRGNYYVSARRFVRSGNNGTMTQITLRKPNFLRA